MLLLEPTESLIRRNSLLPLSQTVWPNKDQQPQLWLHTSSVNAILTQTVKSHGKKLKLAVPQLISSHNSLLLLEPTEPLIRRNSLLPLSQTVWPNKHHQPKLLLHTSSVNAILTQTVKSHGLKLRHAVPQLISRMNSMLLLEPTESLIRRNSLLPLSQTVGPTRDQQPQLWLHTSSVNAILTQTVKSHGKKLKLA